MQQTAATTELGVDQNSPEPLMLSRVLRRDFLPELLMGAAILAGLAFAYYDTMVLLVTRWNSDPNYSHGFLVPIVSIYLAIQAVNEHAQRQRSLLPAANRGVLIGSTLAIVGLLIQVVTVLLPSLIVQSFSLLVVLAGLILLIGGRVWWSLLWPSLLFATFMVPLPSAIYSRIAFPLQLFVSHLSSVVLEIFGIPVHRDGNLIHLPGQVMHVAEACSGLRQLTAFIAICTCAALLMQRPRWYRTILLVSSIPIAVLINILRVTGTGLLLRFGDSTWTEGSLHTLEGLVMVGLGLAVLRFEVAVLDWLLDDAENPPTVRTDLPGTSMNANATVG